MKLDCGDGEIINICYCHLCCNSGGKITYKDEETKQIIIRSGKWLKDKLKQDVSLDTNKENNK